MQAALKKADTYRLNAPTGAWCSLTFERSRLAGWTLTSQCTYRCVVLPDPRRGLRIPPLRQGLNAPTGAWCSLTRWAGWTMTWATSQCTYRCVVLPDMAEAEAAPEGAASQCTYRCVVLPDPCPRGRRYDATSRARSATGPGSTPPDRPAPGSDYHIVAESRQAPPTALRALRAPTFNDAMRKGRR